VLQVLLNVPLALVGAVAALWAHGTPLSVATLVGFVTLVRIATRNTILMMSHYRHLHHEGVPFGTGARDPGLARAAGPVR
jgi:Cu/Ag efflux pump CusA